MAPAVFVDAPRRLESDHQDGGVPRLKLGLPLAQLRQVLQAVQSPEPAQEDQHDRPPAKL